ncbi:MAG: hypothetical protein VKK42_21870 [Lyngbya sp.]|nr:hypothetical protein [Lyngbya sp.]
MNQHRKIKCRINYKHTLLELSVNRKDPCEIIRELISNSYDAQASIIQIYPLLPYSGFIFFDNGTGISSSKEINGVTPMDAFFSIGLSTKTPGSSIGYKCQGSKLCFASGKFALITRCSSEEEVYWRTVIIDNPRDTLDAEKDSIEIVEDQKPWNTLKKLLPQPDTRTVSILNNLDEKFFKSNFNSGTLIFVRDLEVENFSNYYDTGKTYPYIESYIKFNTRHGDIRILDPERTGFKAVDAKNFKLSSSTYNDQCKLFIWDYKSEPGELKPIRSGYPYIDKPYALPGYDKFLYKSPTEIKKLHQGQFFDRIAQTIKFEGITYCLALAIDGNRRALDYYEDLDRQGKKKSGILFSSQRGIFIGSEGIKICSYNEIFNHSLLQEYSALSDSKAQTHYIFMINGSFQLVTDRNSLSEASIKILKNDQFIEKIKIFLDRAKSESSIFSDLINRVGKQISASKIEVQVKQFEQSKKDIYTRDSFYILDVDQLKDKRFFAPIPGEEHGVGSLYTLLSYFVPLQSPYSRFWLRPLNFSGQGIDSIALELNKNNSTEEDLKGLEYKYSFTTYDLFNHPLVVTDHIVCWELADLEEGEPVSDGEYEGKIIYSQEIKEIGCEITDIRNKYDSVHNSKIKVISLPKLISKTFNWTWRPGINNSSKSKSKRFSK